MFLVIDLSLVLVFFISVRCEAQMSTVCCTVSLLCWWVVQIVCCMFTFIDYFVVLLSVLNFASFLIFYSLYCLCILHKWQIPVTLQTLSAKTLKDFYLLLLPIALRPFQFGLGFPYNCCPFLSIQCFRSPSFHTKFILILISFAWSFS